MPTTDYCIGVETQTRPSEFQRQASFTCGTLTGLSKTIGNEKVAY